MRLATPPGFLLTRLALLLLSVGECSAADPIAPADPWAVGIDKRIPWTSSKVVSSPNPPLPYRTRPAFPGLKIVCPIAIQTEPGSDRILVLHQDFPWGGRGHLVRFKDDPRTDSTEKLLDLDGIGYGMAFHPDFARNGYFYIGSNGPFEAAKKTTRVQRYTLSRQAPYRIIPGSETMIIEWPSDGHNGGDLAFGPDGLLYISSGDGTADSDGNLAGQNTTHLLSKVLRIDVDHPDKGKAYGIPGDNPFVNRPGVRPETWAYGFRNPWRLHIDPPTGDLWVGQNGQDLWEQVYLVQRGKNYGWSIVEGTHPFYPERKAGPDPIAKPIVEHHHSEARSLTGGLVYRGKLLESLKGAYVYGDWSTGKIWGLRHKEGQVVWHQELASTTHQITGFGCDSHGELLIADHGGNALVRLEPTPPEAKTAPFPTRLSETGLFQSVKGHKVDPGLIPYSVAAPFWSDGADKVRFLALPGNAQIEFGTSRGWGFPDGTVLVKSFALPLSKDDASAKTWIETRLMTRQQGQWAGYSYRWNADGTDAELVASGGSDQTFTVMDPQSKGGTRTQVWRYPSRTECLVCHSRAANWVLGLSELQMNKIHAYPSRPANQLRTLEHLGLFHGNPRDNLDEVQQLFSQPFGFVRQALWEPVRPLAQSLPECPGSVHQAMRHVSQPIEATVNMVGDELLRPLDLQRREKDLRKLLGTTTNRLPRRPETYRSLVNPYDRTANLDLRARSWLHSNCAQCHVLAGGGNALMELEAITPRHKMNVVDVKPQHSTFDIPDAKLIVPGHPEKSILFQRVARRGQGQMPPLATNRVDQEAVDLLREWILKMPADYARNQ